MVMSVMMVIMDRDREFLPVALHAAVAVQMPIVLSAQPPAVVPLQTDLAIRLTAELEAFPLASPVAVKVGLAVLVAD